MLSDTVCENRSIWAGSQNYSAPSRQLNNLQVLVTFASDSIASALNVNSPFFAHVKDGSKMSRMSVVGSCGQSRAAFKHALRSWTLPDITGQRHTWEHKDLRQTGQALNSALVHSPAMSSGDNCSMLHIVGGCSLLYSLLRPRAASAPKKQSMSSSSLCATCEKGQFKTISQTQTVYKRWK